MKPGSRGALDESTAPPPKPAAWERAVIQLRPHEV